MNQTKNQERYQIIQYICARSLANIISLLERVKGFADLVLIQEPWIFQDNQTTISHPSYTAIMPPNNNLRPRVTAWLSRTLRLACTPRHDLCQDSDVQILGISAPGLEETFIYNIYNKKSLQESSQGWTIERCLTRLEIQSRSIILGDFNAHHTW